MQEFVALGPAGARVDRIAAEAGVNKRMIYHYFGSKEGLYAAVLERHLERTTTVGAHLPNTLGERLRADLAGFVENRAWVRLVAWDALKAGARPESVAGHGHAEVADRLRRLEAAQARGEIPSDLDAAQLELSLVALAMFPVAFPQLTAMITGKAPDDPEFISARSTFFAALARHLAGAATRGTGGKIRLKLRPNVVSR